MQYLSLLLIVLSGVLPFQISFSADAPFGYWPDNNAENPQGSGALEGISRYNFNKPIQLGNFAPGTYISVVFDMSSGQYAWSISNGTWGANPGPDGVEFEEKYAWPKTLNGEEVPAQFTIPALRGHSWVNSMLLTQPGMESREQVLCGGVYVAENGSAEPRYVSGSNLSQFADGRHLKPQFAELFAEKVRSVSRGRAFEKIVVPSCSGACCLMERLAISTEQ